MPTDTPPKLVTIGVIAEEIGSTVERVRRVLYTRRHIRPAAYAGTVRLFQREAIQQVRQEIDAIDARKSDRLKSNGGGK